MRTEPGVEPQGWRFEKRISFDTVAAIIGMMALFAGPLIYWGRGLEESNRLNAERIKVLELGQDLSNKQSQSLALDARDTRITILGRMDAMDGQITQLRVDMAKLGATAPRPEVRR